jgi:hypothetical protein
MRRSLKIDISTARFANVAFSDGSLLYGFNRRIEKRQPIVAPKDIKRYFVTAKESGELYLMSCIFGENRDIFFPKLSDRLHLISFADIAIEYLRAKGYEPYLCSSEDEARNFFIDNSKFKIQNSKFKIQTTTLVSSLIVILRVKKILRSFLQKMRVWIWIDLKTWELLKTVQILIISN